MGKLLRWAGYLLAGLLLIVLVAAVAVWAISAHKLGSRVEARAERLVPMEQASVEEGRHLLLTRGCTGCHGPGLRGTKFFDDPMLATLYAPNLTRTAQRATDQQLAQALRQGVGHDGRSLFVMPSESYSNFTDVETAALIRAIRAVPAGGAASPPLKIGPVGRIGIVAGKFKTAPELVDEFAGSQPAALGPQFAAGRHIAMTVCSGCHGSTLSGKEAEPGVMAPDLTIVGSYDLPAFTRLMRTGIPPSGRALKMMSDESKQSFTHFTDAEIGSLHAYLIERAQRAP